MVNITTYPATCQGKSAAYFTIMTMITFVFMLIFQTPVHAIETESEKKPVWYRNAEERRHGVLGVEVTDWLRVTGSLDVEKQHQANQFSNGVQEIVYEPTAQTVQLGISLSPNEYMYAELVWDAEFDTHIHTRYDESKIGIAVNNWDVAIGRQYVTFGQYYSRFVIDPLLQFGETRADAIVIEYGISDELDLSAFGFQPPQQQGGRSERQFGMALEYRPKHLMLETGVSYIARLINTDAWTQEGSEQMSWYDAEGWGVYLSATIQSIEVSAESILSRNVYNADNLKIDPYAFNMEITYHLQPRWLLSARYEYGDGLDSRSTHRYGIAASWHPNLHMRLDINYLYSQYRYQYVLDEDGDTPNTGYQTAAQITFEF